MGSRMKDNPGWEGLVLEMSFERFDSPEALESMIGILMLT